MDAATESLLRSALESAFPDRAEAVFREVRRWFDDSSAAKTALPPVDDGSRPCVLCERWGASLLAVVRMFPGRWLRGPDFRVPGADTPAALTPGTKAFDVCSPCMRGYTERIAEFGDDPADWPHRDMVLHDVSRALAADGSPEAARVTALLDERSDRTGPRPLTQGRCAVCRKRRRLVTGPRAAVCFDCIGAAQATLQRLLDMFSRLGSR